jgi:hypothetical protein
MRIQCKLLEGPNEVLQNSVALRLAHQGALNSNAERVRPMRTASPVLGEGYLEGLGANFSCQSIYLKFASGRQGMPRHPELRWPTADSAAEP